MYTSYRDYIDRSKTHDTGVDVCTFTLDVNGADIGLSLPESYGRWISAIADAASSKIARRDYIEGKNQLLRKIRGMLNVAEVIALGEHLSEELATKLYGCEVFVEHVHAYQNRLDAPRQKGSWTWHYDDCSPGQIKLLIYLTPTTVETGAFATLKSDDRFYRIETSRGSPNTTPQPQFRKSRVPSVFVDQLRAEGYEDFHVEGDAGTFVLFDQNIIHKATIPSRTPERICLVYNFRPYHRPLRCHIGPSLTSDWKFKGDVKTYQYEIQGASGLERPDTVSRSV